MRNVEISYCADYCEVFRGTNLKREIIGSSLKLPLPAVKVFLCENRTLNIGIYFEL